MRNKYQNDSLSGQQFQHSIPGPAWWLQATQPEFVGCISLLLDCNGGCHSHAQSTNLIRVLAYRTDYNRFEFLGDCLTSCFNQTKQI